MASLRKIVQAMAQTHVTLAVKAKDNRVLLTMVAIFEVSKEYEDSWQNVKKHSRRLMQ